MLHVCQPKVARVYQNKMKFTINFQNFLTPFFQKYSTTLKNLSDPSKEPTPEAPTADFIQSSPKPTANSADAFRDFFDQPKTPAMSSPFDLPGEGLKPAKEIKKAKEKPQEAFDFSDIGDPHAHSKFAKQKDFRFEGKVMGQDSGSEAGGDMDLMALGNLDLQKAPVKEKQEASEKTKEVDFLL